MVEPADIDHQQFKVTRFKGYDPDEVDMFLDRVSHELAAALDGLKVRDETIVRLKRENAELVRGQAPTEAMPSLAAARVLEAAQKTADEIIKDANLKAAEAISAAQARASDIVSAASVEADKRVTTAQAKAYEAEGKLNALKKAHEDLKSHLRGVLSNSLSELEGPKSEDS